MAGHRGTRSPQVGGEWHGWAIRRLAVFYMECVRLRSRRSAAVRRSTASELGLKTHKDTPPSYGHLVYPSWVARPRPYRSWRALEGLSEVGG